MWSGGFTIDLNNDGTGVITLLEEKADITWSETDNGIEIVRDSKTSELTKEDDFLIMDNQ